jgi:GAF domain-containing protein
MAKVARTGKATYNEVEDPELQDHARAALKMAGVTSIATIPLIGQEGTFGLLSVSLQQPDRTFVKDEIDLLTTITSQVTIAFQRIELLEQARAKAQREQMLREITSRVRGSADVDTIMKTAVQEIGRALGRKTYIYLNPDTTNEETTPPPPAKRNGA